MSQRSIPPSRRRRGSRRSNLKHWATSTTPHLTIYRDRFQVLMENQLEGQRLLKLLMEGFPTYYALTPAQVQRVGISDLQMHPVLWEAYVRGWESCIANILNLPNNQLKDINQLSTSPFNKPFQQPSADNKPWQQSSDDDKPWQNPSTKSSQWQQPSTDNKPLEQPTPWELTKMGFTASPVDTWPTTSMARENFPKNNAPAGLVNTDIRNANNTNLILNEMTRMTISQRMFHQLHESQDNISHQFLMENKNAKLDFTPNSSLINTQSRAQLESFLSQYSRPPNN